MSTLLTDLRYAVRVLLKKPGFTAIAVLTLALGIGLNTAVFSAIEAMILRPLPGVRDADRLVQLYRTYPGGFDYGSNSVPHYLDIRERATDVFSGVTAWDYAPISLSSGGETQRVMGQIVSANFFSVLGVSAERGRVFVSEEDRSPGAHPVTVLSHAAWQGLFGGDPQIVGQTVTLNGLRYTIIGVTPADFTGPLPLAPPTLWVPLMQIGQIVPGGAERLTERGSNSMRLLARLGDGVTVDQARDRMKAVVTAMREQHPQHYEDSGILLVPQSDAGIHPQFRAAQVGMSSVVMAVVVMLLLIACVNVANLFLARAGDRAREMAVRLSLGAQRGQLVRQLLTESLVFAAVAGAAGLLLAWWAVDLANGIRLPIDFPFDPGLRLSVPVLLFNARAVSRDWHAVRPRARAAGDQAGAGARAQGCGAVGGPALANESRARRRTDGALDHPAGLRRAVSAQHSRGDDDRQRVHERQPVARRRGSRTSRVQPCANGGVLPPARRATPCGAGCEGGGLR